MENWVEIKQINRAQKNPKEKKNKTEQYTSPPSLVICQRNLDY